jgi:hypothetical protein
MDGLEDTGWAEDSREPISLGSRREGSLVNIRAEIGLRCPLPRMTDSEITVIGPATGAILTGTPGEGDLGWPTGGARPGCGGGPRFDNVTKVWRSVRSNG